MIRYSAPLGHCSRRWPTALSGGIVRGHTLSTNFKTASMGCAVHYHFFPHVRKNINMNSVVPCPPTFLLATPLGLYRYSSAVLLKVNRVNSSASGHFILAHQFRRLLFLSACVVAGGSYPNDLGAPPVWIEQWSRKAEYCHIVASRSERDIPLIFLIVGLPADILTQSRPLGWAWKATEKHESHDSAPSSAEKILPLLSCRPNTRLCNQEL